MGNWLAYVVMAVWPIVVLVVFQQRKGRASVARTTAWLMMLAIMFLPASYYFDAPLLPPFDKSRLTALTVLAALHLFHSKELLKRAPGHRMPQIITFLMLVGSYMTMATNRDPLRFNLTTVTGLSMSDALSLAITAILDLYVPFSIAQRVYTTERDLRDLFDVMSRCLLIYIPFMLYELKMAPVLHDTFYGYSPFNFLQAIRAGGYRPAVFMAHGLVLAMFTVCVYGGARGMWAAKLETKPLSSKRLLLVFTVILLLCKTLAATMYAGILWLLIRRPLRRRAVAIFLWVISISVTLYPFARIEGEFPTYMLVDWAGQASADRAESLDFRFRNEDILLARGMERPVWGWGIWGRSRVYDEDGNDVSITDGLWIMWFGSIGYVGMGLWLAIIILPLLRTARRMKKLRASAAPMVASLAVASACMAVDILPNSRSDYLPIFLGGALWTLAETLSRPYPKKPPAPRAVTTAQPQVIPPPEPA